MYGQTSPTAASSTWAGPSREAGKIGPSGLAVRVDGPRASDAGYIRQGIRLAENDIVLAVRDEHRTAPLSHEQQRLTTSDMRQQCSQPGLVAERGDDDDEELGLCDCSPEVVDDGDRVYRVPACDDPDTTLCADRTQVLGELREIRHHHVASVAGQVCSHRQSAGTRA